MSEIPNCLPSLFVGSVTRPVLVPIPLVALLLAIAGFFLPAHLTDSKNPIFVDVSRDSGLGTFRNVQGSPAKQHIVETMGGGAAFLDYDRDGNLDILLVHGTTVEQFRKGGDVVCALFRGNGKGSFQDVTAAAGINAKGWGMGVAIGDIDNDGWEDLYITCYGPNRLFRNLGNGKFEEIGSAAGVADPRWSVGASFADIDHDGDLDLYVANYLVYDFNWSAGISFPRFVSWRSIWRSIPNGVAFCSSLAQQNATTNSQNAQRPSRLLLPCSRTRRDRTAHGWRVPDLAESNCEGPKTRVSDRRKAFGSFIGDKLLQASRSAVAPC